MDEPVVEEVITENLSQPLEILEQPPDIVENVVAKKGGRPKGSKDSVKRVVKSRKITIVETPLHAEDMPVATVADPVDPVVMKAPRSRAVSIAVEPEVRYVDRYIEHSPRTSIRIAHGHLANEQKLRVDERKAHFSNQIFNRLR
jgi:hypothetical protein